MNALERPDHLLAGEITPEVTLLEASAGTGKTFTIAHRVVRLLLEREIPIQGILVVTFTRAATRELRDRVRKVVVEARDALAQSLAGVELARPPESMRRVLARDEAGRARALRLAKRALDHLDLASIHTIHGFCERALSLHALELGYDSRTELTASVEAALGAVVDDVYVRRITAASPAERAFLAEIGYAPTALRAVAKKVWGLRGASLSEAEPPGCTVDSWLERARRWSARVRESAEEIAAHYVERRVKLSRMTDPAKILAAVEQHVREASHAIDASPACLLHVNDKSTCFNNLRPSHLAAKGWIKGDSPVDHALLVELDRLIELAPALANLPFRELAVELPGRVEDELARRGELGFDQLIETIHAVVRSPEGAARLRDTLGARYQAALIDEFQDTDAAQWAIFHALFGEGKVFDLVGDPKQAIYGFRGADVHAYTAAKRTADAAATMTVNYRSDADYVEAMNVLFGLEGTPAEGERVARSTLGSSEIEYVGVRAADDHLEPRLRAGGRAPLALVRLTEDVRPGSLPAVVAESIVELLNGGAELADDRGPRPLRPGDFAVLCRASKTGRAVAEALRRRGVPCVTSRSENVWGSDAAALLDALFTAALHPHDRGALRAVAVDRLFDLPASELDDAHGRLSDVAAVVREVGESLERHGAAAAVVHLLAASPEAGGEPVAAHLLAYERGERLVTDLRHLGELLHLEAVGENLGVGELLERLRERRAEAHAAGAQEHEQRLESDADSVNITTIHGSKGLEYPIVLLPDLDSILVPKASDETLDYHDAEGRRRLDVGPFRTDDEPLRRAVLESRQESMRLLYVGFTRARCHAMAFFHLPRVPSRSWSSRRASLSLTPLAATLFGEGEGEARLESAARRVREAKSAEDLEALGDDVASLAARSRGTIALLEAISPGHTAYAPAEGGAAALTAREYTGRSKLEYGYGDYSYSRIVNAAGHALAERGGIDEDAPLEPAEAEASTGERVPLAELPKGSDVGTFIHAAFEHLDFTTGAPKPGQGESTYELLVERARREGLEGAPKVAELFGAALPAILETPLGGELGGFSLSRLPVTDRLDELDFHLAVDPAGRGWARVEAVARALGRSAEGLESKSVRGFVTGSIDLVFRAEGPEHTRYYVADYKSNFLGERLGDYAPAALDRAMEEHRYWLQAAFYLLALDRFLAERLGAAYDYDTHCGGALYLFVRGMVGAASEGAAPHGVYHLRPTAAQMSALRAALLGGGR